MAGVDLVAVKEILGYRDIHAINRGSLAIPASLTQLG